MQQLATRFTLILGLGLMLAACGFQLRGNSSATALPEAWKLLYLNTDNPNSEFSRELHSRFSANGISWVKDPTEAAFIVNIGPEQFKQTNLLINSDARAAEYELKMSSRFSVTQPGQSRPVMPMTKTSVRKQMENDPSNVVGKAEEIRILKSEMRAELAQQILRRIGFFAASAEEKQAAESS